MVNLTAGRCDSWWFGVSWEGKDLVATASGSTRDDALRTVTGCVPRGIATQVVSDPPDWVAAIVSMLGELERGEEEHKRFSLSKLLSEPLRRILSAAAAIPLGYVTTYGNIAKAAGSEARPVGRVMATNPLYPIVPCHRVVGAGMTLVGYGGRQDPQALSGKLERLRAETRGTSTQKVIALSDGCLLVYPVERVIEAAESRAKRLEELARKEAQLAEAGRTQLRLF